MLRLKHASKGYEAIILSDSHVYLGKDRYVYMSILLDIPFKYEIIYLSKEKSSIASITLITNLLVSLI